MAAGNFGGVIFLMSVNKIRRIVVVGDGGKEEKFRGLMNDGTEVSLMMLLDKARTWARLKWFDGWMNEWDRTCLLLLGVVICYCKGKGKHKGLRGSWVTYLLCYLIIGSAGTEIFNIPLQGLLVQGKNGCSFEVLWVMFVV